MGKATGAMRANWLPPASLLEAGPLGVLDGGVRPEIRGEEGDRSFEVCGVEEEGPALVAGGDVCALGPGLGIGERERQVAVAEELAGGALFQVEAIEREEEPGGELRDAVLA